MCQGNPCISRTLGCSSREIRHASMKRLYVKGNCLCFKGNSVWFNGTLVFQGKWVIFQQKSFMCQGTTFVFQGLCVVACTAVLLQGKLVVLQGKLVSLHGSTVQHHTRLNILLCDLVPHPQPLVRTKVTCAVCSTPRKLRSVTHPPWSIFTCQVESILPQGKFGLVQGKYVPQCAHYFYFNAQCSTFTVCLSISRDIRAYPRKLLCTL